MVPKGILDEIHQNIHCQVTSYMWRVLKYQEPVFVPKSPKTKLSFFLLQGVNYNGNCLNPTCKYSKFC